jgi:hypothetical protein
MLMPPGFAPSFPASPPPFVGQPMFPPAQPVFQPAPQPQAPPPYPAVAQAQPPARVVRGQAPEEPPARLPVTAPRPAPLTLPPPEALGVAAARPADGDTLHRRLEQLGALSFQVDRLPQGGYRVNCSLPTSQPGRSHRIEVQAASAAEATRLALDKAEEWAGSR